MTLARHRQDMMPRYAKAGAMQRKVDFYVPLPLPPPPHVHCSLFQWPLLTNEFFERLRILQHCIDGRILKIIFRRLEIHCIALHLFADLSYCTLKNCGSFLLYFQQEPEHCLPWYGANSSNDYWSSAITVLKHHESEFNLVQFVNRCGYDCCELNQPFFETFTRYLAFAASFDRCLPLFPT